MPYVALHNGAGPNEARRADSSEIYEIYDLGDLADSGDGIGFGARHSYEIVEFSDLVEHDYSMLAFWVFLW